MLKKSQNKTSIFPMFVSYNISKKIIEYSELQELFL